MVFILFQWVFYFNDTVVPLKAEAGSIFSYTEKNHMASHLYMFLGGIIQVLYHLRFVSIF